jgi:hypothetical protein
MAASRCLKVGIPVSPPGQFRVQGGQALAGLQTWAGDASREGGVSVGKLGARRYASLVLASNNQRYQPRAW